jgi:hypothetical protein
VSEVPSPQAQGPTADPRRALVLRYSPSLVIFTLLVCAGFVISGAAGLVWLILTQQQPSYYVFVAAMFIIFGLLGFVHNLSPAVGHWVAVVVDETGIALKPGPVLGRRAMWGKASHTNRVIPWEDVLEVRLGKMTIAYLGGSFGDMPMEGHVPTISVACVDGTEVRKGLHGVGYDKEQIASTIATFGPHVVYSEGEIYEIYRP